MWTWIQSSVFQGIFSGRRLLIMLLQFDSTCIIMLLSWMHVAEFASTYLQYI